MTSQIMCSDLRIINDLVYIPNDFLLTNLSILKESADYSACMFQLDKHFIVFRVAKITPKKIGQFVTLWKRNEIGIITPYDVSDKFDFIVVSISKDDFFGKFVFPKKVLGEYNVLSNNNIGGKLAMRVYPPWDVPVSKQAQKTQAWQLKYFLEILPMKNYSVDTVRLKKMYV